MNRYGYVALFFSPFMLLMVFVVIFCTKVGYDKFIDLVIFNAFPDILKKKKDQNNQIQVYFRKEKVLLEGEILQKVKNALTYISFSLGLYVVLGFGQFLFTSLSYDCEGHEKADCFEFFSLTSDPVNCSDPKIVDGKITIVCYRLSFQLELAVGVSYGMYKACTVLLTFATVLMMKMDKKRIFCLKIWAGLIWMAVIIVIAIFQSLRIIKFDSSEFKILLTVVCGIVATVLFIINIPWSELMYLRDMETALNEENMADNPAVEHSPASSEHEEA